MERTKYLILLILTVVSINSVGQTTNRERIYHAYISGNMSLWKNQIVEYENIKNLTVTQKWELIDMYYGYIAWCIGNKNKKEATGYIEKAEKLADFLEKSGNNTSSAKAYQAALIGYKIGLANYKAPFIGPKGQELAKEAVKINPNNPIALIEQANVLYFAPSIVGGSKPEAIKYFEKALDFMEKNLQLTHKNWRYLNLLTFLYQAYTDENQTSKAQNVKHKIETIEPNFNWIKNLDKSKYL